MSATLRLVRAKHPSWCQSFHRGNDDPTCYLLPPGVPMSRYQLQECPDFVSRPRMLDVALFGEADGRLTVDLVIEGDEDRAEDAEVHLTLTEAQDLAERLLSVVRTARATA